MKKTVLVLMVLISIFILQACKTNFYNKIDDSYAEKFSVKEDKYLMIEDKYYVQNLKSSDDILGGKDIGIICKDDKTDRLNMEYNFENANGKVLVINGIDIGNRTIEINGENYKINEYDNQLVDALNLNDLFEEIEVIDSITLNPDNYTEFIDNDENVYVLGKILDKEEIESDSLLFPVKLEDEIITEITFNTETGLRMSALEKTTMLTDSEGAKKIKTIFYGGIYKTQNGNFAVEVNGEYRKLEKE